MKINDWVQISTHRANVEQFNGKRGQITTLLPRQDCCYVSLGLYTPIFYLDEVAPCRDPKTEDTAD